MVRLPPGRSALATLAAVLVATGCVPSATQPAATATGQLSTQAPSISPSGPAGQTVAPGANPSASIALPGQTLRADAWTRLADAPAALTEVAAVAHQGRVWVAGGLRADGSVDDRAVRFDPVTGRWADGPRLPVGAHHATLVSTGNDLYLLGGYAGSFPGNPTAAVRRLDVANNRWVDGPALPEARGAGAAAFDGARIVFGGGVSTKGVARQVWALESGEWRLLGALARAREHLGASSDGQGRTWFLGGRSQSLEANVGTAEVVEGSQVRPVAATLSPRSGVAGFWHPGAGACLAGGEGPAGTHAEVECVSLDGRVTTLPSLAVSRHGLGAAVVEGIAYVVLGGEQPGLFVSPVVEALPVRGSTG